MLNDESAYAEVLRVCRKQEILSFRTFVLVKNNFQLHFETNWVGRLYRKQDAYCMCEINVQGFSELAGRLRRRARFGFENYLPDLYEAYKMMRPYAQSNWEMFM